MVQGSRDGTGEWEWCGGENACLSPPWPTCGLSLLLTLLLAPRVFLQVLLVSLLHKNRHFQFIFDLGTVDEMSHLVECPQLNYNFCYHYIIFLIFFYNLTELHT